ncbi:MAG: hypothetical protein KDK36_10675 [Leptospiraceae bacterium]|nr:hypothetical protein [Leptospiraceae bacterium]
MIKKLMFILLSFSLVFPVFAEPKSDKNVDQIFFELIQKHEQFLNQFFQDTRVGKFEKAFFSDIGFAGNMQTVSFFENLKTNMDNGRFPVSVGFTQISYSSYSNINGVPSAVSYEYKSDGKNIILTKGTMKNGKLLKSVYQYNPNGKQLEAKDIEGKKVISNRTYKYEI